MRLLTALATAGLVAVLASCGGTNGTPKPEAANPSQRPLAAISPPPPGGEVPPELQGLWLMVGSQNPPAYSRLHLTADGFSFLQATGRAVVNGDEIDFFASPGCQFADAVGRYLWSLTANVLHFDALNEDPCDRRVLFDNVSYTLVAHPS